MILSQLCYTVSNEKTALNVEFGSYDMKLLRAVQSIISEFSIRYWRKLWTSTVWLASLLIRIQGQDIMNTKQCNMYYPHLSVCVLLAVMLQCRRETE